MFTNTSLVIAHGEFTNLVRSFIITTSLSNVDYAKSCSLPFVQYTQQAYVFGCVSMYTVFPLLNAGL